MPARPSIEIEKSLPRERPADAAPADSGADSSPSYIRRQLKRAALKVPAIAALHRQREELRAECARLRAAIAELAAQRDAEHAERTRLAAEVEALAAARLRAEAEGAAAAAAQRRLAEELAALHPRADALAQQVSALEGKIRGLMQERADLEHRIAGLSARAIHLELIPTGPPRSPDAEIAAAVAAAAAEAATSGPLVSIVCVCRNAEAFVARALASMRGQAYRPVELLVQDGDSTDGTLDIVRRFDGAKLHSERDAAALDGLLRAARRAQGEIVAVCWADDELLPHAAGWAAAMFERHGGDVVYGDQLFVYDADGAEWIANGASWDRRRFLRQEFFPPFSSAFFRRSALLALAERLTVFDHDEFEFWLWLDRAGALRYAPGLVSKFHVHAGSRWTKPGYCETMVPGRRRAIARYAEGLGAEAGPLAAEAQLGLELWAALHEISCTGSIPHSLGHLERILDRHDGDPRFLMTLVRLLNQSKRSGLAEASRILAAAQRLGFDFGVLAQRKAG